MPHVLCQNYSMAKPIEMCAGLTRGLIIIIIMDNNNNNNNNTLAGTKLNPVVVVSGCPLVKYSEVAAV